MPSRVRVVATGTVLAAALCGVPCHAAKSITSNAALVSGVAPSQTSILLLPVIDETGDKPEMVKAHIGTVTHRIEYEFLTRGFPMLGPEFAQRAADNSKVNLSLSQERTKHNLTTLGLETGVAWVVSLSLINVHEENVDNFWTMAVAGLRRRARATCQVRVVDVKTNQFLVDVCYEDTRTTQRVLGNIGTSGLFKQAIDTTVQRSVENLLHPFPIVSPIDDQWSERDLLCGATAPVCITPAASDPQIAAKPVLLLETHP